MSAATEFKSLPQHERPSWLQTAWTSGSIARPSQAAPGILAFALGVIAVVASLLRDDRLAPVQSLFRPMPRSAAIGLLLCGVALMAAALRRRRVVCVTAAATGILGIGTLLQYGFGVGWNPLRSVLDPSIGAAAGGMALSSALSFALLGVALLAVSLDPRRGSFVCAVCGTTVAAQSGVAFVWHGFGIAVSSAIADATPHETLGLAIAGIGTLASAWNHDSTIGVPRWLPLPVALGVALVSVSLWQQSESDRRSMIDASARLRADRLSAEVQHRAMPLADALVGLARLETERRSGRNAFDTRALAIRELERFPTRSAIGLLNADFTCQWMAHRDVAASACTMALGERGRRTLLDDRRSLDLVSGVDVVPNEPGLLLAAAVQEHGSLTGYVVGLFRYEDFFAHTIDHDVAADYSLHVFEGSRELYRGRGADIDVDRATTVSIPFLGAHWHALMRPRSAGSASGSLADRTLVFGFLLAGLLGWAVHLGQGSARTRTEMTAAQAAHAASELRYKHIIDSAADIIYRTDVKGRFTYVNPAGVRAMRWTRNDLIGRDYLSLIRSDYQDAARAFYEKQGADRIPSTYFEFPAVTSAGDDVWIGQHVQPLMEGERLVGFQAVARDVSDRVRAQRELQRMRDAALETARLKTEFVANTSHEIRTPLNGILGFSALLLDTGLNDQQRIYADGLRSSADALLSIVNDILDFSKIEAGMLRLEVVSFNLRASIDNSVNVFTESARQKGLQLEVYVDHGLPQRVTGDPGRLRQVLTNLIANAIKFTDRGSITVAVMTESETDADVTIQFSVRDTGVGIDEAVQQQLFQPFVQGDGSTSRRYGGTGLGLAISRQIAELMGGSIWVESTAGFGSTFSFTAKLAKDDHGAIEAASDVSLDGVRVLMVADTASMRDSLTNHLAGSGVVASWSDSSTEAHTMLRNAAGQQWPFRIVVLSLLHAGEDPIAFARSIKDDPSLASTRVVLIPAVGVLGDAHVARSSGVAAYLPSPVHRQEFQRCLQWVIADTDSPLRVESSSSSLITRHTLQEECVAGARVLVTDDNPISLQVTKLVIEKLGFMVDTARNGAEAVEAVSRTAYALVLMDLQMPVMDGYAATVDIRRIEPPRHTPIIAYTANAGARERCFDAGMDDVLEKPIRNNQLSDIIERWVYRAGSESEFPKARDAITHPSAVDDVVDSAVMADVEKHVGVSVLDQMIATLLDAADASIATMQGCLEDDQIEELKQVAHRLRGASMTLGFARLGALCATLEEEGERYSSIQRHDVLERMRDVCEDMRVWVRRRSR